MLLAQAGGQRLKRCLISADLRGISSPAPKPVFKTAIPRAGWWKRRRNTGFYLEFTM